jgi:hypothetical protein
MAAARRQRKTKGLHSRKASERVRLTLITSGGPIIYCAEAEEFFSG